jgi:hypothetical protein
MGAAHRPGSAAHSMGQAPEPRCAVPAHVVEPVVPAWVAPAWAVVAVVADRLGHWSTQS